MDAARRTLQRRTVDVGRRNGARWRPELRIAIVGCGYVADHYLQTLSDHPRLLLAGVADRDAARAEGLAEHYGTKAYRSTEDLLADSEVELVVNLTDPRSHYEVSRASLLAGKHVYSEKPLSMVLSEAQELVALARERGLLLSSAPCSVLSEAAQTLWKAVRDGAVGRVQLVYAELDDNPIYLMRPESWTNERGVPWPYLNEYEVGCTMEHAGYYLTWLAAIFGPAESVTAFSSCLVPDKTALPLNPPNSPDFSVACIVFRTGVVARLTCSIVAPYDHRIRIIGNEGVLSVNECWQYAAPVYLERFSQLSLNARKSRSVRSSSVLQSAFGVGGRRQMLVSRPRPQFGKRVRDIVSGRRSLLGAAVKTVSRRELVSMDFFRGVAEMADAIEGRRRCLLPPDFVLHVNELALAIHAAGAGAEPYRLTTSFEPLSPSPITLESGRTYGLTRPGSRSSLIEKLIARLHRH
jgi:predicted dehydrogenase